VLTERTERVHRSAEGAPTLEKGQVGRPVPLVDLCALDQTICSAIRAPHRCRAIHDEVWLFAGASLVSPSKQRLDLVIRVENIRYIEAVGLGPEVGRGRSRELNAVGAPVVACGVLGGKGPRVYCIPIPLAQPDMIKFSFTSPTTSFAEHGRHRLLMELPSCFGVEQGTDQIDRDRYTRKNHHP
jgi:hypothetical protein